MRISSKWWKWRKRTDDTNQGVIVVSNHRYVLLFILAAFMAEVAGAMTIRLSPRSPVTVWGRDQVISGIVSESSGSGTLLVNGISAPFTILDSAFSVSVRLGNGTTMIVALIDSGGMQFPSDTLRMTLGYRLEPECYAFAIGSGSAFTLHAVVIDNPETSAVSFAWSADARNPSALTLSNNTDSVASCTISPVTPSGEYYFNLLAVSDRGDSTRARTFVTVDSGNVHQSDISTDHARWIDSAIVYGITPSIFVMDGHFPDITAKLPEIASLGVNTIWIQPVYKTHGFGQGYDVTDYFSLRGDLGKESEFRALISTAHALGLHVLLDFVPNHTSIYHPYAVESSQYGTQSHYWDYYQREFDNAPYASNYHSYQGFVNYFWDELPNLNYNNPEVRRWITEAAKYWIENYDIDGYRVDVAWGVNARAPDFTKAWRLALKRIKPEILLLAEDKAPSPIVFDERFDAAYDWTAEESWVSHWVWQTDYNPSANPTIFNALTSSQRAGALSNSLTNNGKGYSPGSIIFRFMENNDTYRFLETHDLPRTKMVAAMMFSLTGMPLIYNGQEIGASGHPYNAVSIFDAKTSIASNDPNGLFPFYQLLTTLRRTHPALRSRNFNEVTIFPFGALYAFRRWTERENIIVVMNMGNSSTSPRVSVPTASMALDSTRTYFLNDLLTGEFFPGTPSALANITLPMPAYTTRILLLDTTSVTGIAPLPAASEVPAEIALYQNYPNPFNPATVIRAQWPVTSVVRMVVYDILGREVATLADGQYPAGRHAFKFDARGLASGTYFCRMEVAGRVFVRKMLLLR